MIRIPVAVPPRPYEAVIESGLASQSHGLLRQALGGRDRIFVITVPPVRRKWGKKLINALAQEGFSAKLVEMPDGETHKKLSVIESLAEKLVSLGADRTSALIAFGGGVVGDVTGLLASLYMRGIDLVHVPTTVLAQVDASIGGKTGVNLRAGKNLIGTFHQPRVVIIDPALLATLPDREYRAGLYESLKGGVIANPELFRVFEDYKNRILGRDPEILQRVISESVKLKAQIVSADGRESGLRRILNFGHTIGHALEAETGYRKFLHGEAVAWGMIAATNIALLIGKVSSVTAGQIVDAIFGLGALPKVEVNPRNILRRLQADKKTQNCRVLFVLPTEIGKVEVTDDVPEKIVLEAVTELRRLSGKK